MNPGKLNKRLKLISVTSESDGIGGYTETETTAKTTWGSLEPMSQREQLIYGLETGSRSYRCFLRYDENYNIDQNYHIEWTDRFFQTRRFRIVQVLSIDEGARVLNLILHERTD